MITQDAKISMRCLGIDEICGIQSREVDCTFTGSQEELEGMPSQLSDMCEFFKLVHPRVNRC